MKKLTRKLFISILSMAFAVIAIGTTTFAWITISNTAEVKPFTGTVEDASGGIELQYGNGAWSSSIDISAGAAGVDLSDITTVDGKVFKEFMFNNDSYAEITDGAEGKYIEIEFKIRRSDYNVDGVGDELLKVYIDGTKVSFECDEKSFTSDVEVTGYDTTVNHILVANAARMSLSYKTDSTTESTPVIYEKAAGTTQNINDDNTTGTAYEGFAYKYWIAKGFEESSIPAKPNYETLKTGETSSTPFVELGSEEVTIVLRVWVEGFDSECHANILTQTLNVTLGFTTVAGSTPAN